jgi:hypothetical protein
MRRRFVPGRLSSQLSPIITRTTSLRLISSRMCYSMSVVALICSAPTTTAACSTLIPFPSKHWCASGCRLMRRRALSAPGRWAGSRPGTPCRATSPAAQWHTCVSWRCSSSFAAATAHMSARAASLLMLMTQGSRLPVTVSTSSCRNSVVIGAAGLVAHRRACLEPFLEPRRCLPSPRLVGVVPLGE